MSEWLNADERVVRSVLTMLWVMWILACLGCAALIYFRPI